MKYLVGLLRSEAGTFLHPNTTPRSKGKIRRGEPAGKLSYKNIYTSFRCSFKTIRKLLRNLVGLPRFEPLLHPNTVIPNWRIGKASCGGNHVYKIDYSGPRHSSTTASKPLKILVGPPRFELGTSCTPIKMPTTSVVR